MLRLVLGVIAGVVAGFAVVMVAELIGHQIFPPPPGLDPSDREAVKALIPTLPIGAFVAVLIAWGLGTFAASAAALLVSRRRRLAGGIAAAVVAAASAATLVMIPHPAWFVAAAIVVVLGGAWLADRLFGAKTA